MKAIKIILGFITFLVLAFFATGFFVPEITYTTAVQIKQPLDVVFTDFQNTEMLKKWVPEIKSITPLNEVPGKVGSTYQIVVVNEGQTLTMSETVLAYEENKQLTLSMEGGGMLKTNAYTFSYANGLTTLTQQSTCSSNSHIMSCVFPYFKGVLQGKDQAYLDAFKKLLEK